MLGPMLGMGYRTPTAIVIEKDENERFMALEARIDALELACAGLWDLLKFKHAYTDDELARAVQTVDMRDGQLDGKVRPVQADCPHCGRKLLTRSRKKCLWCGAELKASPL
jgi:predicted RNA-binding Zn-ribbon protein involved in translation (DUF1610 family)